MATFNFEEISYVNDETVIYIKTPFEKDPLIGKLNKSSMLAEGDKVFVPITIRRPISDMPFKTELDCEGEIVIDKTSLFSKILDKPVIK